MKRNESLAGSRKRTILVVEDNEVNRKMLCSILESDFDVIETADGLAGLAELDARSRDISLVLLDVYMPELDGFEFLRRKSLDERYDTIPVIVTTSGGSIEDEIRCLESGANDFIVKPYNPKTIINRVTNMIRLRESASIVNRLTWDSVTGLFGKEFFYHAVEDALAVDPGADFDMICCDIDNYNALVDRYGEDNCDLLLRGLAAHLEATLPDALAGGRLVGDALAFLVPHDERARGERLISAASDLPFPNANVKFGIVEHVDHAAGAAKICNLALSAIETRHGIHGVEIVFFDDELHQKQVLEQIIRESMEEALGELQFTVSFQPKHDVRVGRIGGAEALVRWSHPEIGYISPALFIPIFERDGFITKLDFFVWEEACKEVRRCIDLGLPVVPISVNASRLDFDLPDLPARIAELADRYGIDRSLLHVELTETAYADNPDAVTRILSEIKELGFSTELDDFGAGYSSLVSLNTLPLDVMKLDMSMVRKATELDDFRIVESTIKLAQVLGLLTVVEGVETAEEAAKVTEMGCDMIQGYYYSKPLAREDFEDYLKSS